MVDKWAEANPDKRKEVTAKYRDKNRQTINTKQQRYYHANKDKYRDNTLQKTYGITLEQYNNMIAERGGLCDICKGDQPLGNRNWHVDHDHETGEVRGLLCVRCNLALGGFQDSLDILDAASKYLASFKNVLKVS